jgi:chemotaxis protein MotB
LAFALALCSALAACQTSQLRGALDEREAENKALREERAGLKTDMRDLSAQKDSLETALAEANARLLDEPQHTPSMSDPELDALGIGYGVRDGRAVISIPTEISFAPGKAELSTQGKKALKAVASTLREKHATGEYWIEGHTDSDPIVKSKFASNRDLSLARSMAVLRELVDHCDIADGQCVVAGWGQYRPVAGNDTAKNKAKNRRVEIVVEQPTP